MMEKHRQLILKVFNAYCHQQNLYFSATARNALFKKLLLYIQKNWTTAFAQYGKDVSEDALVTELVRLGCKKWLKNNQAEDIELLHTEAYKLILKYQPMIYHIVHKQSQKGESLDSNLQADLIANIQAKLLQKANNGKLTAQFKGDSLFSTYLYRVVYHSMIDEWRKMKRQKSNELPNTDNFQAKNHFGSTSNNANAEYADLIEQHLHRYQTLLNMLPTKRCKRFEFAVKINYEMQLEEADIRVLYADCSRDLLQEILSYFGASYHDLSKVKIFELIGEFLSILEKNSVHAASFRIWFQTVLNKMKKSLFKELPQSDKKTMDAYFEFLLYKFYQK